MSEMIFGYISDRRGNWLDYRVGVSRDDVAAWLFARNPRAQSVATCRAFPISGEAGSQYTGKWKHVYVLDGVAYAQAGSDIRWANRPSK